MGDIGGRKVVDGIAKGRNGVRQAEWRWVKGKKPPTRESDGGSAVDPAGQTPSELVRAGQCGEEDARRGTSE